MPCRILLVRHGETEANQLGCFAPSDDVPLTETGRRQAKEVAEVLLADFAPRALLSSPFRRARETSEIIGETLGLRPAILPGIHERDFGCLKGLVYQKMGDLMTSDSSYHPDRAWYWRPESGESLEDVRLRAVKALRHASHQHSSGDLIVVCHGAVIQAVEAHVTNNRTESSVILNCGIFVVNENGGITL